MLAGLECVHLSKNNFSINSINFDHLKLVYYRFIIVSSCNYYDDILVNFSKILIFWVHLEKTFFKVLFLMVLVSLMQYFRQFVVKSEVKHFILILASFHFLRIVVKKYRIRLSNLSTAIF
jgi:hypothetical protein